jgi:glycosyltransferase involved in cell wall biosynthesis
MPLVGVDKIESEFERRQRTGEPPPAERARMAPAMTARPRGLLVTGTYFPELSAGGLQCQAVARILQDRAPVAVLTTSINAALPAHETVSGVPVSRIAIDVRSPWSSAMAMLRIVGELARLVPRVDFVHIQGFSNKNIFVSAAAKLFGRRVILHLQTARHDEPETIKGQGRLAWWAYSTADLYLSVSPGLTASYLAAGLSANRIREVPNGVDASRFRPASPDERASLRSRLKLPASRPLVLFVGVISPDKQPHVLLDAWLRLQQNPATASTLVLVGATDPALFELGGRLIERLSATAQVSGFADRVLFVPPTDQIQDYFRAADIYVMPSLREGLPIALLEAMACGLPCVASRLPGATDVMIEDGVNGRLVPVGDVEAFAAAIAGLLAAPQDAAHLGAAARRIVEERYTVERVADMWFDAYQDVLTQ